MFDIGFLELILIAVIGLLVLGPERLPVAARTLGRWIGKARRMTSQLSKEIDRQVELEELKAELKKQSENLDINEEARKIQDSVNAALKEAQEFEPLPRTEPDKPFVAPPEKPEVSDSTQTPSSDSSDDRTENDPANNSDNRIENDNRFENKESRPSS